MTHTVTTSTLPLSDVLFREGRRIAVERGVHIPVLLDEVIAWLDPCPGRVYVDGTVGGGGHAEAILRRLGDDGTLIGIDRDPEALRLAEGRLAFAGDRCQLMRGDFRGLGEILDRAGVSTVNGVLLDIGVSTMQLFTSSRGFSFDREGPLDMRMDPDLERSAADIVNTADDSELEDILRLGGEVRWARRIARAIVQARHERAIRTTVALADVIRRAVPYAGGRIDPSTRAFQAIRIAVNDELEALREGLRVAMTRLAIGGRLCVIAFHSLEERIVKEVFRSWKREGVAAILTPKPVRPTAFEVVTNPRSRSARLRVVERVV